MTYVHLEHLLGKKVRGADGTVEGRILAVRGVIDGPQCRITEFELGTGALLDRLGIVTARLFGLPAQREPKRVPWQKLDLSDPERPKLRE